MSNRHDQTYLPAPPTVDVDGNPVMSSPGGKTTVLGYRLVMTFAGFQVVGPNQESINALFAALCKAREQANPVVKGKTNKHHGYPFAGTEALILEALKALEGTGLHIIRSFSDHESGKIICHYLLIHQDGATISQSHPAPVMIQKGRPEDKARAAALTYDYGYYLIGLLMLPRVEKGVDIAGRDDTHYEPAASPPKYDSGKQAKAQPTHEQQTKKEALKRQIQKMSQEEGGLSAEQDEMLTAAQRSWKAGDYTSSLNIMQEIAK